MKQIQALIQVLQQREEKLLTERRQHLPIVPSRRSQGMCACKCKVDVAMSSCQAASGRNISCVLAQVFRRHVSALCL